MRILSYSVSNFRGISGNLNDNRIEFNDSNTLFLFGPNNVGKSTYLKSYEFFYNTEVPKKSDFFMERENSTIEFEIEFKLENSDYENIKRVADKKLSALKNNFLSEDILKIKRSYLLDSSGKVGKAINYTFNYEEEKKNLGAGWEEKNYGGIGLDSIFKSLMPKPIFIKAMPTESEVEKIVNDILADKAKKMLNDKELEELKNAQDQIKSLQGKMYNPESINNYKKHVNEHYAEIFPDLKIELSETDKAKWTEDKLGKKFSIHFETLKNIEEGDSIPTSHDYIGHGAIRTAIFTLLLMRDVAEEYEREENKKDYLVLFEEPELFLHPKLIKELRSLIYKVSENKMPYQVLCASHSPQMIDISKPKSSLIRVTKSDTGTKIFQINDKFLSEAKDVTLDKLREEMYEVLRFNPFICESFYSDEVILVEGPTEEIILRGYLSEATVNKDVFVVNCGTVNNIPFYQKVFNQFNIKYNIICDTDKCEVSTFEEDGTPVMDKYIQGSIYNLFKEHIQNSGLLRVHKTTFEPAHSDGSVPEKYRFNDEVYNSGSKPFDANNYWKNQLTGNLSEDDIKKVPIIKYIKEILGE